MNNAGDLDLITEMFMVLIDNVRNSFRDGVKKAHLFYPTEKRPYDIQTITDFIINMEKGEYFYSGGREFLKMEKDTDHPVSINFASSGQQEILWMLNLMYVLMLRQENVFLIIEEPEAHIYPSLQKKIMEFIALFTNIQESGVFITTHSPYMLTVANNLYYAGVLSQEGQLKEVSKVINKNYIMKKGELSAYKLLNMPVESGEKNYIDLLDEERREIRSSLIDDVSSQINELYTALYDIELDNEFICSSEKVLNCQILDLYATNVDYDSHSEESIRFFKIVQNKLHFAAYGHTEAEIAFERADAQKPFMGLTSFSGELPALKDFGIAKKYLKEDELKILNNLVSGYFDLAEINTIEHRPMYMNDYIEQLEDNSHYATLI